MATQTSNSINKTLHIGDTFTPLKWGIFAVKKFLLFDRWLEGKTIFDPTMGDSVLLRSLVELGIKKGFNIKNMPIKNLFGNEINTEHFKKSIKIFEEKYHIDMSKNFSNQDILEFGSKKFDIIFGNPPWQNFADLPENYKQILKDYFYRYDLVRNKKDLLLGGSRIDIASLIIQKSIKDNLNKNGEAIFFVPLSIFLNDGANEYFRKFKIFETEYSLDTVYDFNKKEIFKNISTRYGLVHFTRDNKTTYPIDYFILLNRKIEKQYAKPIKNKMGPLSITPTNNSDIFSDLEPIILKEESKPRQGINSCGANYVFFFDKYEKIDNNFCRVSNKQQAGVILPNLYVYPVATSSNFKQEIPTEERWVLLPYGIDGKALSIEEIKEHTVLLDYLLMHKEKLSSRKGVLINSQIKKGVWWAMLGVGSYNFFKYKIIWEAYGRNTFKPKIFKGDWQANQSLQAFIPLHNKSEAIRVLSLLQNKKIEEYLKSTRMDGTMNWAQPGRIKNLIEFESSEFKLF